MPYLRNSIAYDIDFWYTCVKNDDILRCFIHFFDFFLGGWGGVGGGWAGWGKVQKMIFGTHAKNHCICDMPYLHNSIAYDHDF